ncbi:MAG: hypothetical protein MZV70_12850 [Desulfobacterales bacterium]|nr:hypothetical protein [Desulfobacterales bacterium]
MNRVKVEHARFETLHQQPPRGPRRGAFRRSCDSRRPRPRSRRSSWSRAAAWSGGSPWRWPDASGSAPTSVSPSPTTSSRSSSSAVLPDLAGLPGLRRGGAHLADHGPAARLPGRGRLRAPEGVPRR